MEQHITGLPAGDGGLFPWLDEILDLLRVQLPDLEEGLRIYKRDFNREWEPEAFRITKSQFHGCFINLKSEGAVAIYESAFDFLQDEQEKVDIIKVSQTLVSKQSIFFTRPLHSF